MINPTISETLARLYIGVGKDRDNKQIDGTYRDNVMQQLLSALTNDFGGASVLYTTGYWKDDNGNLVTELSLIVEVLIANTDRERKILLAHGEWIRTNLNQNTVIATFTNVDAAAIVDEVRTIHRPQEGDF